MPRQKPWYGIDFDGTLVSIIDMTPVKLMVDRVKCFLRDGKDVRIVTSRANSSDDTRFVSDWTLQQFGRRLPVTNKKDHEMVELWDDRAVQVFPNTGKRADGKP